MPHYLAKKYYSQHDQWHAARLMTIHTDSSNQLDRNTNPSPVSGQGQREANAPVVNWREINSHQPQGSHWWSFRRELSAPLSWLWLPESTSSCRRWHPGHSRGSRHSMSLGSFCWREEVPEHKIIHTIITILLESIILLVYTFLASSWKVLFYKFAHF